MKLGLVSAILPDETFEQVIDYAAKVGFECVEVCCWPKGKAVRRYAGITHIDLDQSDDQKLAYYRDYAESRGVKISSLAYYPNPLDANEEAREVAGRHIRRLIEASKKMGVNMVTTFIGRDKTKSVEQNLDLFEEIWTPIVRYAEEMGVKIGIENCPMLYTKDEWPGGNNLACAPYIWREMFRRVPSDNLGLNYDPSHPYLQHADYIKPVYDFKDKIFHIHFKDIKIYPEKLYEYGAFSYPALWHSPKLPGLGGVDFGAFVSALNDIRYQGYACIEVEDKAFEGCIEDVKSGIEQSYRFMRQFI
ncbi:MAG TPA: sugar phosphate isomerase/epimerase [Candidatus Pullichristensenella excrementigallinarum]|uniref:Sugar phosphate isomerase/epimerase n=1 Tax=Candidatus Pullichristensenella excrementigallinarum TaxID=2840907 RepID=A0A9D1ICM4_9FIRM|nr:sugar phosphate isomerase/epimerase [Candidatus Pullichristensenella excrementigallinarum]